MRGTLFMALVLCLAGCGTEPEAKVERSMRVGSTTPLADGNAYIVMHAVEVKEGNIKHLDEPSTLWFVSGTKRVKVEVEIKYPTFTPLADGAALLADQGRLWRLEGGNASPITEDGVAKVSQIAAGGFWFARWVTDKEGLTEGDREQHLDELAEEGAAEAEEHDVP